MALLHQDTRPYEIVASEAAEKARDKLDRLIEQGKMEADQVISNVMEQVPQDFVVRLRAAEFTPGVNGISMAFGDEQFPVHGFAVGQLAERAKVPRAYLRFLLEDPLASDWGPELLAGIFNRTYQSYKPDRKFLIRTVDEQVRGVLSDRFRRLDSRPIIDAFIGACQAIGAIPVEGHALDTKVYLKAMLPVIFEPIEHEVMTFGVCIQNSDFGNGALSLNFFCLRLWCTNFAMMNESWRRVHLGKRLDDTLEYSRRTYELDTKTVASAINDVVTGELGNGRIEDVCKQIQAANDQEIDIRKALEDLRKKGQVTKAEVETTEGILLHRDIDVLPRTNSPYTMANAISWTAKKASSKERTLELERLAGAIIEKV